MSKSSKFLGKYDPAFSEVLGDSAVERDIELRAMDRKEALERAAVWQTRAVDATNMYNAISYRCCALEDKLAKLLDMIDGEQIVPDQFLKEARFLIEVGKK